MESTETTQVEAALMSETGRLADLVDELLAELGRLRAENERLAAALSGADKRAPAASATRVRELEAEREAWVRDRQAVADRIEVILGKFQWLERHADTTSASASE